MEVVTVELAVVGVSDGVMEGQGEDLLLTGRSPRAVSLEWGDRWS